MAQTAKEKTTELATVVDDVEVIVKIYDHKTGVPYECTQAEADQLLGKVTKTKEWRWVLWLWEKPYLTKEDMKKVISTHPAPQNFWRDTQVTVITKNGGADDVDYLDI